MQPKVSVYFDFNSPYALLSAIRIYQIYNKDIGAIKQQETEYPLSTTDITHPVLSKVKFELRPIDFGSLSARTTKGVQVTRNPIRGKYTWSDPARTLPKLGIEKKLEEPNPSWWPQGVSLVNKVAYILMCRDTFHNAAKEVISNYNQADFDPSWRDTITEAGGSLESAIASEYVFRVYEQFMLEHNKLRDDGVLSGIVEKILAKYPEASRRLGGTSTVLELAKKSKSAKSVAQGFTEEAIGRGVFGVPTFSTEQGEIFWGNDHLVDAAIIASENHVTKAKL
ncbi:hypothetical protein BB558_007148 [Smittium angustum]|uniref:DSBA-like thioredoxin domain-containing protein n=1 Tax=Smittium angustum TaxID=133377 RepID=A0A2U1IVS5_SMIAN|nr:hypothetical protein BB558_007259 [Smittium angustum]PVZ96925.1 hypothetical protein BB558_007148 [Smittium angustum]